MMKKIPSDQEIQPHEQDGTKRLFVAVNIPEEIKQDIKDIQHGITKKNFFKGTLVKPEHMHLTLQFLGDISTDDIPQIIQALREVRHVSFPATISYPDTFTKGPHIKVVYVGVLAPDLSRLVKKIQAKLEPWAEIEERPYVPHLTLARVKKVDDREGLLRLLRNIEVPKKSFNIDEFVLKESVLHPEGPEHSVVEKFVLKEKDAD